MANIFNPTIGQGIGFEQPVQQPSAIGAIGNIFNAFASAKPERGAAPTQDEKFAMAVREFEDAKGASFQWDRKGIREFTFQYPQFTDQAKSFSDELQITSPMEQAQEGFVKSATEDWIKTPEGALAIAEATAIEQKEGPEAAEAYFQEQYVTFQRTQVELNKIERDKTKFENQQAVDTAKWSVIAGPRKDYVDGLVKSQLAPLVEQVKNGQTVAIPPEVQAALGIDYNTVTMSNLRALLVDSKNFIDRQNREAFGDPNMLPPEDWNKQVMGSIDGLITLSEAFDTPQEQANALSSLIEMEALHKFDQAGMAVTAHIIKTYPPEVTAKLLSQQDGAMMTNFAKALVGDQGQVFTTSEIKTNIANGSVADAKKLADDTMTTLFANGGMTRESFTMFTEAQKRSGFGVIDATSFQTMVGENVGSIKDLTSKYPEFAQEFGDWVYSDIEQTRTLIERRLGGDFNVVMNKGKFSVVLSEQGKDTLRDYNATALRQESDQEFIDRAVGRYSVKGLDLNALNSKVNTLKFLGNVGTEVQGAFEEQFAPKRGNVLDQLTNVEDTKAATGGEGTVHLASLIDKTEGAGNYDTLFSHAQREGGDFAGVEVSKMSIGDLIKFSNGEYGEWAKEKLGYKATPMGRYQFVGTTLEQVANEMGLPNNIVFSPSVQDAMFHHLAQKTLAKGDSPESKRRLLRGVWEGFKNVSDEELDVAIAKFEGTPPPDYVALQKEEGAMMTTPMLSPRPTMRPSDLTATQNAPETSVRPTPSPEVGVPQGTTTRASEGAPVLSEEVINMLRANPDQALQALIEALNAAPEDKKTEIAKRFEELFK